MSKKRQEGRFSGTKESKCPWDLTTGMQGGCPAMGNISAEVIGKGGRRKRNGEK